MMRHVPTWLLVGLLTAQSAWVAAWADDGGGACRREPLNPGTQSITVTSGGLSRAVRLFVPAAEAGRRALPLVLDLHGSGSNGEEQAQSTRLSRVAAKNGFVVANPSGGVTFPKAPDEHYWNIPGVPLAGAGDTPADAPDDLQFIQDLIDQLSARTCIDPRRIYVTGMSGGARMTSLLACRLSTRIAAIAPVAGLRAGLPSAADRSQPDAATCTPQRPMPIVTFHGTADAVNPYAGGGTPYWGYGVPAALHRWAELDHCDLKPREHRLTRHVTLVRYERCAPGAEIWLYRTDAPGNRGGGHSWPGSVVPPDRAASLPLEERRNNVPGTEIDASELMWKFFAAHPLTRKAE